VTGRKERQVTVKLGKIVGKRDKLQGKGRNKTGMVKGREERETSYREESE
jgi:hypothetical protein